MLGFELEWWQQKGSDASDYMKEHGLQNFRRDFDNKTIGYGKFDLDPIDKLSWDKKLRLSDKLIFLTKNNKLFRKIYDRVSYLNLATTLEKKLEAKYYFAKFYGMLMGAKPIESIPDNLFGNPKNVFYIDDKPYTSSLLRYYIQYAQTCRIVDWSKIDSMLEIGGGFGLHSEIIKRLYPHIKINLLDLDAILQVQEEYLKNTLTDMKDVKFVHINELESVDFDLLWNSTSFQVMTKKTVKDYIKIINIKAKKFVVLHNQMQYSTHINCLEKQDYINELSNFSLLQDEKSQGDFLELTPNVINAIFKRKNITE